MYKEPSTTLRPFAFQVTFPHLRLITKYDGVIFLKSEVNRKFYWWYINTWFLNLEIIHLLFKKLCWICFYPQWIPGLASNSFILLYMCAQNAYMATASSPNYFLSQYHALKSTLCYAVCHFNSYIMSHFINLLAFSTIIGIWIMLILILPLFLNGQLSPFVNIFDQMPFSI